MRSLLLVFCTLLLFSSAFSQSGSAIFLHHSTGAGVYYEGNVAQWITDYNAEHGTNFELTEFAYPNTPWDWENYPYDYWKLWADGSCNNTQDNIQCLDKLCQNYELIIFKHCFPGAGIEADYGNGDVTSPEKTLNNYKLQYRALLALFDQYPNNKFIVWTLAPLHRNATNTDQANRAAQFVDWVKNTWLTEDGNQHSNVTIFDFFGLAAEQNANPAHGKQYCLKYDYEGDHNGNDSHPNSFANQTIGPLFAEKITEVLTADPSGVLIQNPGNQLKIVTDHSSKTIHYSIDSGNDCCTDIEVFTVNGQLIYFRKETMKSGKISLPDQSGIFIFRCKVSNVYYSEKINL